MTRPLPVFALLWLALVPGTVFADPAAAEQQRLEARERFYADDYAGTRASALAGLQELGDDESSPLLRAGLLQWAGLGANALGDVTTAQSDLEASLRFYRQAGNPRAIAAVLNDLAAVYGQQSNRTQQLAVLVEAHRIFEERGETRGRAALANSLGNYYAEVGEPAKALPFHEQSVALRRTMDDVIYLADGLQNLGVTLRDLKRDPEARVVFEEALKISREAGDEEGLAGCLTNLGAIAGDEGKFDEALACYQEALRYDEADGYKSGQAILTRNIGTTLHRAGRTGEAVPWLDRAVALSVELDDPERLASAHLERAAVHEALGEPAAAVTDLRAAMNAKDRLAEAARSRSLLELQSKFETLEKERQIERLEHEATERKLALTRTESARLAAEQAHSLEQARRQTAWIVAAAVALVAGLLIVLFFLQRRTSRRLARALSELSAANRELQGLYQRKSEWLSFAVHELRSPLFGIDGLCAEYEAGLADAPKTTVSQIRQTAQRMRSELDAWLETERREQDSTLVLQKSAADLGTLTAEVVERHQAGARAKQIALSFLAEAPTPVSVDARRIHEVIDNLVSNALKFSPPNRRVTARTGVAGNTAWCCIEDEGPGLQEADFKTLFEPFAALSAKPTAGESSTGLGLHGARQRVEAHGGELTAENRPDGGAVFRFTLPLADMIVAHG
ncbi:MAG: tetratricopeptide repeat-containing sensor histidine kinase [Opitutaceae bacterium]|nr:tetratricopeptide repeat-containing sensor histidine kinase [Cephaloticoccus sp.]MCP5529216.1 tetratricopeptide repeat-containing sensor histidine kinase [Opitutaceae bacterium]